MSWRVAFEGSYDRPEVELLAKHIDPDTIVLDIGASLGIWTVQLATIARERGAKVWAFEPNPNNIPWIKRNLELNMLDNVTVNQIGLGDQAATAFLNSEGEGVGNATISESGSIAIKIKPLDTFCLPSRVSAIKIDVEGYEPAVLRGALQLLLRDGPVILGEFSRHWLAVRGEQLDETLDAVGYSPSRLVHSRRRLWRLGDTVSLEPLMRPVTAENLFLVRH